MISFMRHSGFVRALGTPNLSASGGTSGMKLHNGMGDFPFIAPAPGAFNELAGRGNLERFIWLFQFSFGGIGHNPHIPHGLGNPFV